MSDEDGRATRRNVLKVVGIGAASVTGVACSASAASSDVEDELTDPDRLVTDLSEVEPAETCSTEYTESKCDLGFCTGYTKYTRQCQDCTSGTTCTQWSETDECCDPV